MNMGYFETKGKLMIVFSLVFMASCGHAFQIAKFSHKTRAIMKQPFQRSEDYFVLRAASDNYSGKKAESRKAEFVTQTGLEGDGPLGMVNSIIPSSFRLALYVIISFGAVASTTIDAMQSRFQDVAIDSASLVALCTVAFIDYKLQVGQVEKAKANMRDDQLGKEVWYGTSDEKNTPAREAKEVLSPDLDVASAPAAGVIMEAKDLFANMDK